MRRRRLGFWLRFCVVVIKPPVLALTRRRFTGQDAIPATGPVILAANHISYVDPFPLALFVYDAGRVPRFLVKAEVFRWPLAGRILRGTGQIPVERGTATAGNALGAAAEALRRGECVVIYPEGTVTRDPAYWPMVGRTGVARLALETGAPVVPVAQWGAQHILGRSPRLRLLPRRTITIATGRPVALQVPPAEVTLVDLRRATATVLQQITSLVADIRGQTPPARPFDPRPPTPPSRPRNGLPARTRGPG